MKLHTTLYEYMLSNYNKHDKIKEKCKQFIHSLALHLSKGDHYCETMAKIFGLKEQVHIHSVN